MPETVTLTWEGSLKVEEMLRNTQGQAFILVPMIQDDGTICYCHSVQFSQIVEYSA